MKKKPIKIFSHSVQQQALVNIVMNL